MNFNLNFLAVFGFGYLRTHWTQMISQMPVKSEVWLPIPAQSVAVNCGEETASVEVKQDFLGNDLPPH